MSSEAAKIPRILVVGCGSIGGVVAASLIDQALPVTVLSSNSTIAQALRDEGFRLQGETSLSHARGGTIRDALTPADKDFDYVILAVQPPQVEDAARSIADRMLAEGRVVCLQNGLCEERVAAIVGRDRVIGAVVAWGASMISPGVYDRTSSGGFTIGRLDGEPDDAAEALGRLFESVGPVTLTSNLLGARFSKLAINCAISTLGTIGGDRLGPLMRHRFVRRLSLEIMTEVVEVAKAASVSLEKVSGTIDLQWLSLSEAERSLSGSPSLMAKHTLLLAVGARYRRLRSSMLAAIERGRPPAIDFLNGEIVERGVRYGVPTIVNRAAAEWVWQIVRGDRSSGIDSLRALYAHTR